MKRSGEDGDRFRSALGAKAEARITPADLTKAIVDLLFTAEDEAKVFAATHKVQFWKALGITWFRKRKKRRQLNKSSA